MQISRIDVVSQVADAVRQWIVDGALSPGERINETHVAGRLKVSRTPVREALARLVGEGALLAMPNLGFFVAEISEEELDEIYVLRLTLDALALQLGGLPDQQARRELTELNARIAGATSAEEAVRLDERWHLLLISSCKNSVLTGFIGQLIDRTRRYELMLFAEPMQRAAAAEQHARIIEALERDDLVAACSALQANLTRGTEPLRRLVGERTREASGA